MTSFYKWNAPNTIAEETLKLMRQSLQVELVAEQEREIAYHEQQLPFRFYKDAFTFLGLILGGVVGLFPPVILLVVLALTLTPLSQYYDWYNAHLDLFINISIVFFSLMTAWKFFTSNQRIFNEQLIFLKEIHAETCSFHEQHNHAVTLIRELKELKSAYTDLLALVNLDSHIAHFSEEREENSTSLTSTKQRAATIARRMLRISRELREYHIRHFRDHTSLQLDEDEVMAREEVEVMLAADDADAAALQNFDLQLHAVPAETPAQVHV